MNIYSLSDNEKVVSPCSLDDLFSSVLAHITSEPIQKNPDCSFQFIVETMKEEASEYEEVLNPLHWQIVSKDINPYTQNFTAQGMFHINCGYS